MDELLASQSGDSPYRFAKREPSSRPYGLSCGVCGGASGSFADPSLFAARVITVVSAEIPNIVRYLKMKSREWKESPNLCKVAANVCPTRPHWTTINGTTSPCYPHTQDGNKRETGVDKSGVEKLPKFDEIRDAISQLNVPRSSFQVWEKEPKTVRKREEGKGSFESGIARSLPHGHHMRASAGQPPCVVERVVGMSLTSTHTTLFRFFQIPDLCSTPNVVMRRLLLVDDGRE